MRGDADLLAVSLESSIVIASSSGFPLFGRVAKLADAPDLGSCGRSFAHVCSFAPSSLSGQKSPVFMLPMCARVNSSAWAGSQLRDATFIGLIWDAFHKCA